MAGLVITLIAAASAVLVAIWAPVTYAVLPAFVSSAYVETITRLVSANGLLIVYLYMVSNTLSALIEQQTTALVKMDGLFSWIATISLCATFAVVFVFGLFGGVAALQAALSTGPFQTLLGVTAFSLFDVFYLQRLKTRRARRALGMVTSHLTDVQTSVPLPATPTGPFSRFVPLGVRELGPFDGERVRAIIADDGHVEFDVMSMTESRLMVAAEERARSLVSA